MKRAESIWVRNNGEEIFLNRFNGEDFEIEPGKSTEMEIECATLCLGFGEEDKTRCLRRLGWAFMMSSMSAGLARLSKFSFHMTEQEANEHGDAKNDIAQDHVSAPVIGKVRTVAGDAIIPSPATEMPAHKPSLLEKLAHAQAAG